MPRRLTDEERVILFGKILKLKREDGITQKNCCIRYGLSPTAFPEFKKTIRRIIERSPELETHLTEDDKAVLWK